ncbi:hypothetical protein EX30DRAFT_195008 [Ascodesmis nigricans]|uniref:RING-type domain-containing protein n=1 Tax=Ascodesmis nigricans TaxID=341454 RepID=A0A4S2MKW8_9PEZI|nr:hypothetical protein EX30DRAFT_195008 [Ascodesmis nigricans]
MSSPSRPNRERTPSDDATRELVFYCTVCFTPLAGSGRNSRDPPYWLTSCGHIVCSNHLFPDGGSYHISSRLNRQNILTDFKVPLEATQKTHTCPHCQRTDISLAAVNGSEPPEGLRDYFTPQLELLDNFTGALRAVSI